MNDKLPNNGNVLCKYEEYLEPTAKKTHYDMPFGSHSKKLTMHKHRLSGLLPPPAINKPSQNSIEIAHSQSVRNNQEQLFSLSLNPLLLNKKNLQHQARKSETLKLQKLFPKSVTIKFQDVLDIIPNNRHTAKVCKSPKLSKTITPFKIFEMAENKFYLELFHQKRKQEQQTKEKQSTQNNIDSLFNVRSIKMIKKLTDSFPVREDHINSNISCLSKDSMKQQNNRKKKYESMFKKQADYSIQYEKQNPPKQKLDFTRKHNIKLSLKDIRKFEEFNQLSQGEKSKARQLVPLSEVKNKGKLLEKKDLNDIGDQKSENKSANLVQNKRKKSKEISPMVTLLNQDVLNSSFGQTNNSNNKQLDTKYFMSKKHDFIFEQKFSKYLLMLKRNSQIIGINISFPQTYGRNQFNFYVGKGNNSKLVKEMLKKRWWLGACEEKKDLQKNNVIWTQLKDKTYYGLSNDGQASIISKKENSLENSSQKQAPSTKRLVIHNHFEQNEFLGNKKALFYNMRAYYESINQNVFDYLPLTFHITSLEQESWQFFINEFNKTKEANGKNIWILKPGQNSNRGNGITVHQTVQSIESIVGQSEKEGRTFILQKYIEKPFLYKRRKFDIRCYMLLVRVNEKIKGFWYKEGYIRTSGYEYSLDDCGNSYVHLTNDAIQQHCDNYGKYEDKNKLSYEAFQKYLDVNYNCVNGAGNGSEIEKKYDLEKDILPKLRKVCIDSIKASHKCLGKWRQGLPTFELFGLDFMIDQEFNPWLIEINTNPCLQTEGRVLEKVIIPLLDNVFKLTIDCVIPPPLNWSNSTKHLLSKNVDKNLFELVFDESLEERSNLQNESMKQLPMDRIGEIDEDNEMYEEDE